MKYYRLINKQVVQSSHRVLLGQDTVMANMVAWHSYRDSLTAVGVALIVFMLLTDANFGMVINDGWIAATDLAGAHAASIVFQMDHWRFPWGANPNYGSTSVVYTDSIPLVALFMKVIAQVTGQPIYYFGLWFLLNIILVAYTSFLLGRQLGLPYGGRLALSILYTANVMYLARMVGAQHIALSSSWLILLCFLCLLNDSSSLRWCGLLLIAAGIHAYLLAITLVFFIVYAVRNRVWMRASVNTVILGVWMYLLGYTYPAITTITVNEFKPYGADLAFFFNSFNWGVLPEIFIPAHPAQYDAHLFIGSGACLLAFVALILLIIKREANQACFALLPLILPVILLLLAATGLTIQIAGFTLLDISIPTPLDKPFRAFRAIGRFGWGTSCLIILGSLVIVFDMKNRSVVFLLITAACLLQLLDVRSVREKSMVRSASSLEQHSDLIPLTNFLHNSIHWNREVYKIVSPLELEALMQEDAVLAKLGARFFTTTHSARQSSQRIIQVEFQTMEALKQRRQAFYIVASNRAALIPKEGFKAIRYRNFIVGGFDEGCDSLSESIVNNNTLPDEFDPKVNKNLADSCVGVYGNEDIFHWLSPNALISLSASKKIAAGIRIIFTASGELFNENPGVRLKVSVLINNRHIKDIPLDGAKQYSVTIDKAQMPKPVDNVYNIKLLTNAYFNPSRMGISSDNRDLSIKLFYIGAHN